MYKRQAQYEGHLLDSADSLLEITEFSLDLERQVEKLYVYAHMKNDQDTREAKYQEYYAKAMTLYSQLEQAFAFYEPEFMEILSLIHISSRAFVKRHLLSQSSSRSLDPVCYYGN